MGECSRCKYFDPRLSINFENGECRNEENKDEAGYLWVSAMQCCKRFTLGHYSQLPEKTNSREEGI